MKLINVTRSGGQVTFQTVSIDATENVVFSNQDTQAAHWPTLPTCTNQLGAAPSPNSSECPVPAPPASSTPPYTVTYGCKYHPQERGTINVFAQLEAATTALPNAVVNQPIAVKQVVSGGQAPYAISDQLYQITNASNQVIQKGSGIGPGLQLNPGMSAQGITVSGTPTVVGTYTFTFTVNDSMGRNLQQTQYTMTVAVA
jgi:hypothetical protein